MNEWKSKGMYLRMGRNSDHVRMLIGLDQPQEGAGAVPRALLGVKRVNLWS